MCSRLVKAGLKIFESKVAYRIRFVMESLQVLTKKDAVELGAYVSAEGCKPHQMFNCDKTALF